MISFKLDTSVDYRNSLIDHSHSVVNRASNHLILLMIFPGEFALTVAS